jgi:hypothetical protein
MRLSRSRRIVSKLDFTDLLALENGIQLRELQILKDRFHTKLSVEIAAGFFFGHDKFEPTIRDNLLPGEVLAFVPVIDIVLRLCRKFQFIHSLNISTFNKARFDGAQAR